MAKVKGLPPIYTPDSRVLILGTFPSAESRKANAYYSNNTNRFWKLLCDNMKVNLPNSYIE